MDLISIGYGVVALLGLAMGSFAGATVWRIRARQLLQDKAAKEKHDPAELKRLRPLTKANLISDRSQCLHCHHTLSWYDLLPVVSWLSTNGKCRYCHKPIGRFEPLIEVGTALAFVAFYWHWVTTFGFGTGILWVLFGLWLVALVMLAILFAYDAKWFLLPDRVMVPLIAVSIVLFFFHVNLSSLGEATITGPLLSGLGGILILGGLYLLLWFISKGQWVGFGDVKLGLALGLLLADWRLAFLALFLANLIGVLFVIPGLVSKKLSRRSQVPFGPFLIAGFGVSLVWGYALLGWYDQLSLWLYSVTLMV
ncbi:MAG TPA: prepilin peptidase [Candidatus Saccharibacteria bacterium]|nr:prepilin peptidase [Candidatus Saccharibacteria bacterium]HRK94141.1 prepilin peptidase [Candidatus Saccharibacteria bacterium]